MDNGHHSARQRLASTGSTSTIGSRSSRPGDWTQQRPWEQLVACGTASTARGHV